MKISYSPISYGAIRIPLIYKSQKDMSFTLELIDLAEKLYKPEGKYLDGYKTLFFAEKSAEKNMKDALDKYNINYAYSEAIDNYSNTAKDLWARTGHID